MNPKRSPDGPASKLNQLPNRGLAAGITVSAAAEGEHRVLARIAADCQPPISEASLNTLIQSDFLAALTANESAGIATAARFEPAVYHHLLAVASTGAMTYGGIRAASLDHAVEANLSARGDDFHARYLTAAFATKNRQTIAALEDSSIRQLATSWGYTQIMGYHIVGSTATVRDLIDPRFHYHLAVELLTDFARQYKLDPRRDFVELFHCWNSGSPTGKTYDPNYVSNGLRRMQVYREILAQASNLPGAVVPANPATATVPADAAARSRGI